MSDSEEQPDTPEQFNERDEDYTSDEGVDDPLPKADKKAEKLTAADLVEADLNFGFRVISAMSEVHLETLLRKLEANCSLYDTTSLSIRMKRMDWNKIVFDPFTADECRAAWLYLKNQTRKFRIMAEVVQEIKLAADGDPKRFRCRLMETAPGFPKKPPTTPAALFCREMWKANPEKAHMNFLVFQRECLEGYHKLDETKQATWKRKLEEATVEHTKQVKEFYAKYPNYEYVEWGSKKQPARRRKPVDVTKPKRERGAARPRILTEAEKAELYPDAPKLPTTPQGEFIQSKLSELGTIPEGIEFTELKAKYTARYQKLSDKKKVKWITYVLKRVHAYLEEIEIYKKMNPGYVTRPVKLRNHLSKADIELWAAINDQPEKPARNVFETYWRQKRKEPEYQDLSPVESRRYADEEFKNLSAYDSEMCKIDFRRSVLEYKKNIEKFFDWVPDILKPHILFSIPKKYRFVLMTHVEKLPESMLLEEEEKAELMLQENEEGLDPDEDPAPPSKKRKKTKDGHQENQTVELEVRDLEQEEVDPLGSPPKKHKKKKKHREDDDDDIIEYVDQHKILNGGKETRKTVREEESKVPKARSRKPKPLVKPEVTDYSKTRSITSRDVDDMIRGIFDARPNLGHNYSAFYFYAKFVARELLWINHVNKFGLVYSAQRIFSTFLELSNHKKNVFITQSWDWYINTNHLQPHRNPNLMIGEPAPPPRTPSHLYRSEVLVLNRRKKGRRNLPAWGQLSEAKQNLYIKKLYRDTKEYVKAYEQFIMKLRPEELTAYMLFQSSQWEGKTLAKSPIQTAWRGYIFPFPTDLYSEDEEGGFSDPEVIDKVAIKERGKKLNVDKRLPSLLDNDDLIEGITSNVTREEPTIEELMTDTSSSDED